MRISNQCNNVNSQLVILSDECCTQVVYYETKYNNNMSNLKLLTLPLSTLKRDLQISLLLASPSEAAAYSL